MLGHAPISFRPICYVPDLTLPAQVFASTTGVVLNYTLEMFPSSGTRVAVAKFPFITLPSDTLSNQPFVGSLDKPLTFHRSIVDRQDFGRMSAGYGELEINNADGAYDATYLTDTIDGRRLLLKTGQIDADDIPASYDTYPTLLNGIAQDWFLDDAVLRVSVLDNGFKLDVPASPNKYGGTGGLDGTSDMAGKSKPRAWGSIVPSGGSGGNVTPPLVDPANQVYQVNDGAVLSITAVYDGGFALTPTIDYASLALLNAATIPNGSYATCLTLGIFRLGAKPFGVLTCDVAGESTAGFVNDTANIVRRWLSIAAPKLDLIDVASFAAVTAAQPAIVGYYLGLDDNRTMRQVVDELMGGIGGFSGLRRDGVFDIGIFVAPSGTPVETYTTVDILENSLRRLELPSDYNPPPKRQRVTWGRNHTIQPEVLGAVGATRAQMLKEPYSVAESTNTALTASVTAAHPLAQDPEPKQAFFWAAVDAVVEANRQFLLKSGAVRSLYSFKVKSKGFVHNIGHVIKVTYPRFDLTAGKLATIVGLNDDAPNNEVEITAFG